jgi:predicted TPR repeat methyltransferase
MNRRERRATRKQGRGSAVPAGGPAPPLGPIASLFGAAVNHFRAGRMADAERACRDALVFDPRHFESLHLLGVIALKSGRGDIAVDVLRSAIAVNGTSAVCQNNMGLALAALGRLDEAGAHFTQAVALDPTLVAAHVSLGNTLKAAGDLAGAAACYRRALALEPRYAVAHFNLANVLKEQGALDEAIAHYQQALAFEPNSAETLSHLANALDRQGNADDALSTYRRALAIKPGHAESHNNLGNLLWRQGDLDAAITHYRSALAQNPAFVDARNNLGSVLRKQGKLADALDCFEAALDIDPRHAGTQVNLCTTVYTLSLADRDAAAACAAALLDLHGDKPLMRRGLGGILGVHFNQQDDGEYSKVLFDGFAEAFDKTLAELQYLDMVEAITKALDISADRGPLFDVLDAGCGTGLCGPHVRPFARSLVGVDLSPRMLDKARAAGIYDRLACGDAVAFMAQNVAAFDLIISSDVLPYVGNISRFAQAAHRALRDNGRIAISAESLDQEGCEAGFRIAPSGRYKHARRYLETTFGDAGFAVGRTIADVMRMEGGQPIEAWVVVAEKRVLGREPDRSGASIRP